MKPMTEVIKVEDCVSNIGDYDIPIHNAIIIPKGATNGDMIKATFPDLVNSNLDLVDVLNNARDWWNAPYRIDEKVMMKNENARL